MTVHNTAEHGYFRLVGVKWSFVFMPQSISNDSGQEVALTLGRAASQSQVSTLTKRDNECVLGVCTDRIVSRSHAKIYWKNSNWYITCLSKNAIRMGTQTITLNAEVKLDTTAPVDLHIGNDTIFLLFPSDN
jgi:pSer/pThr/pTyr-binding forkhead associated (FHA) protein